MASEREDRPAGEATDRFYHGVIRKLFTGSRGGLVLSASGREIPFVFEHVVMLGEMRRFDDLREGMPVGFDVGWTSKGLRVTTMRVRTALRA